MHKAKILGILIAIISCVSCKQFLSKVQQSNQHKETLFDKLIAAAPDGKIPYPFSDLIIYLSQYGDPVPVLIPLGGSTQRKDSTFKDPRRVLAFAEFGSIPHKTTENKGIVLGGTLPEAIRKLRSSQQQAQSAGILDYMIAHRLFIGYVEGTKQLEVMSLLPGGKEFDFQVVENYGAKEPEITMPPQEFCKSCHQHGGPIFTPTNWSDTNASDDNAALIMRHHPSGYIDKVFEVEQPHPNTSTAAGFNDLVRTASRMLVDNRKWHACSGDTSVCRMRYLQNNFMRQNLSPPAIKGASYEEPVASDILRVVSPFLDNTDFFSAEAARIFTEKIIASDYFKDEKNFLAITFNSLSDPVVVLHEFLLNPKSITPPLNDTEIELIFTEVENYLITKHRKDEHLGSDRDPTKSRLVLVSRNLPLLQRKEDPLFERKISTLLANNAFRNIFKKQTSLNDSPCSPFGTMSLDIDSAAKKMAEISLATVSFNRGCDFYALSHIESDATANTCQIGQTITCEYFGKGFSMSFIADKEMGKRPPQQSTLTVKDRGGKKHTIKMLCTNTGSARRKYKCYPYDVWRIRDAITQLAVDKSSPLYDNSFNEVAIFKKILANLGYDLKTINDNRIDWLGEGIVLSEAVASYQPTDNTGKALFSFCAGCHGRGTDYDFLDASDAQGLCDKVNDYRIAMIDRIKDGSMPVPESIADPLQQAKWESKKTQLLASLKKGEFAFCSPPAK